MGMTTGDARHFLRVGVVCSDRVLVVGVLELMLCVLVQVPKLHLQLSFLCVEVDKVLPDKAFYVDLHM